MGSTLVASANDAFLNAMKRYEGRWVGSFTLHSTATGYTETFPVEQQYWMDGERLHGVAVIDRNSKIQTAKSVTFILKGKLVSEITRGEETERYIGVLNEGGILWLPGVFLRAKDHQLMETIVIEDEEMRLKTEGFDTYIYQEEPAHIVYRGNLVFQK